MRGRYFAKDQRALERELFLNIVRWPHWDGSYNIAPSQLAPAVAAGEDGNVCELMRFGLVPFFAHGEAPTCSTINAKRREPTILTRADCAAWLAGNPDEARAVLKQYPDDLLLAYPIGKRVNSPKNNDAGLIEPIQGQPAGALPLPLEQV
jgi:putative SOS response-associated peptidase YedK